MDDRFAEKKFQGLLKTLQTKMEEYAASRSNRARTEKEIVWIDNMRKLAEDQFQPRFGVVAFSNTTDCSLVELGQLWENLQQVKPKRAGDLYQELMLKLIGARYNREQQLSPLLEREKQAEAEIRACAREYEQLYRELQTVAGTDKGTNWTEYTSMEQVSGCIYFCDTEADGYFDNLKESDIPHIEEILMQCMPSCYDQEDHVFLVPYTQPLAEPISFRYDYEDASAKAAVESVRMIIYQMLRLMPDYHIQLHLMDGESVGSGFQELNSLEKVRQASLGLLNQRVTGGKYQLAQLYFDNNRITEGLHALELYMTAVAKELGASSFGEYNRINADPTKENSKGIIPGQVLIIQNFPVGFSDADIELLQKLMVNGKKRGISILLLNNRQSFKELTAKGGYGHKAAALEQAISVDALLSQAKVHLEAITYKSGAVRVRSTLMAESDGPCRLHYLVGTREEYLDSLVAVKMDEKPVENGFDVWFGSGKPLTVADQRGVTALEIPFAIRDGRMVSYRLGEAMNAHGLISGGTGSGKSTLLHMLISSIVLHYSPKDVEIWLADYKITEFFSYRTNTPPHIRFVGLSRTQDFSYAFIDKITEEMERRQKAVADADWQWKQEGGQSSITDFKSYRNEWKGDMRRLIIIIDEFHVMAQHAQLEPEYKQKLENLLAEARALGIILVFSDQTIVDGLRGLSEKGKKQMKARIAMANYEDEIKETLGERDREKIRAALHLKQGDVAVQTVVETEDEDGFKVEETRIERARVVYINGGQRFEVNRQARERYDATDYETDFFDDREIPKANWADIARWEQQLPTRRNGQRDMQMYVGRPLDLQFCLNFSLMPRKGSNMMSVSGSNEQQMRVISSVIESFRRQKDSELVIFADSYAGVYLEYEPELKQLAQEDNISVYDKPEEICYQINRLLGRLNHRGNQKKTLVVWLGLDALADIFREEKTKKPESLLQLAKEEKPAKVEEKKSVSVAQEAHQASLAAFERFLMMVRDEEPRQEEPIAVEKPRKADSAAEKEGQEDWLYNACPDIERMVHLGPTRNIYNLVVYDTAMALKDFRGVKISDFNHRIAFVMSDEEAMDFLGRANLIRQMEEHMAFYFNGRKGKKFIPYALEHTEK